MSNSFHAHHSPMGAHSSLTLGMYNAPGGLAMESGQPAADGVFVGYQDESHTINYFPFFEVGDNERDRYKVGEDEDERVPEHIFTEDEVHRDYLWATDRFSAGDMQFEVLTPFFGIPDPANSTDLDQKFACCPSSLIRLSLSNTEGNGTKRAFLAFASQDRWLPVRGQGEGTLKGFVNRDCMGFATRENVQLFTDFDVREAFTAEHVTPVFLLGPAAGLYFDVPAGESRDVIIAVGYYREGLATFGIETRYWYTRYFANVEEVMSYALENQTRYLEVVAKRDLELQESGLNEEQRFLISHATRSYYGSTEWLDDSGRPRWVVNEGEYRMLNTFDLTVDMLFYEMRFNPWTVRNVLEQFVSEYRYYDFVFEPSNPDKLYPGGVSFTHDMGVHNHFSPEKHSCYEVTGLDRKCFSHMTCEQLVNWICCTGVYYAQTEDKEFLVRHRGIIRDCLESLQNRDNPVAEERNGIMSFESSRTIPGGEITTYDSLDHSLGQARNNIYLAGKSWAAYVALNMMFEELGLVEEARSATHSAQLAANTIAYAFDERLGYIPAVLEGDNQSAIISAIEGLVFPKEMGMRDVLDFEGPYAKMMQTLKRHLENVLKKGICLYDDNGWKLSSTADNSWMSKICLAQHVARDILGVDQGNPEGAADHAHAEWERNGSTFSACSDQFHSGIAKGSLYYPRIVTNILWLDEE